MLSKLSYVNQIVETFTDKGFDLVEFSPESVSFAGEIDLTITIDNHEVILSNNRGKSIPVKKKDFPNGCGLDSLIRQLNTKKEGDKFKKDLLDLLADLEKNSDMTIEAGNHVMTINGVPVTWDFDKGFDVKLTSRQKKKEMYLALSYEKNVDALKVKSLRDQGLKISDIVEKTGLTYGKISNLLAPYPIGKGRERVNSIISDYLYDPELYTLTELSAKYGVSKPHVCGILRPLREK